MTTAITVVLATMLLSFLLGNLHPPRRGPGPRNAWAPVYRQIMGRPRRESLYDTRMFEPPYAPDGPAWVAYTRCQRSLARDGLMHETGRKRGLSPGYVALILGGAAFAAYAFFRTFRRQTKEVS